ncbi:hypothetical protein SeMB42_g07393 [Synchytrium endobioticum]|uniref:Uncharacterized protein n=1 Tax=Synchytrium endobioticum TaxID=286115 RepID=A0A507C3C8_9FUNG|nr:hypothetical protein SeMB42_g07393 [Synchytrium endobioticum]
MSSPPHYQHVATPYPRTPPSPRLGQCPSRLADTGIGETHQRHHAPQPYHFGPSPLAQNAVMLNLSANSTIPTLVSPYPPAYTLAAHGASYILAPCPGAGYYYRHTRQHTYGMLVFLIVQVVGALFVGCGSMQHVVPVDQFYIVADYILLAVTALIALVVCSWSVLGMSSGSSALASWQGHGKHVCSVVGSTFGVLGLLVVGFAFGTMVGEDAQGGSLLVGCRRDVGGLGQVEACQGIWIMVWLQVSAGFTCLILGGLIGRA